MNSFLRFTPAATCAGLSLAAVLAGAPAVHAQSGTPAPCAVCAQANQATESQAARTTPNPPPIDRWLDLQTATLGVRYRDVENSEGTRTNNGMQYQTLIKAALRIDEAGRYLVAGSLGTGTTATASWNATGIGTGDGVSTHSVKELFFSAAPVRGVSMQAGSMPFLRGQTTEVIGYDNDFYLMGERGTVKRPKELYLDEISVTVGYVGDVTKPSVFDRLDRIADSNYRQVLVGKKLTGSLQASADFTTVAGVRTMREAIRFGSKDLRVVDWIRYEMYQGMTEGRSFGYAVHTEKGLSRLLTVGGGFADIDPGYGALNADRFGKGRRGYGYGTFTLPADFSVQVWAGRAVGNDYPIANNTRVDVVLNYNLANSLRRAHALGSVSPR